MLEIVGRENECLFGLARDPFCRDQRGVESATQRIDMKYERLRISDVVLFTPNRIGDARGFFSETFRQDVFDTAAGPSTFVQDNHAYSAQAGIIRGLHFQRPPYAQGKLVRVVRGAILDIAVDIRIGSPTYGQHVAATLSAQNWQQLWVPVGFAHGYCILEPETEVIYKASNYYSPVDDLGLAFDDPALAISWPVAVETALLSDRDRHHPNLAELQSCFRYAEPAIQS
jgi:dTDP-4-dehydrorhamnose 3,5-epimerase